MARLVRFYQKTTGECIERNNNVQVDQDDFVTWYKSISTEKEREDSICHIIGEWYHIALDRYNRKLPDHKKFDNFIELYNQAINHERTKEITC
ncbi:hypothetical protein RCL_jg7467.t1 [Rhizophagus clarus]|uniref:Uncharacterized protein n=1 Tax=Rhizophagus clarus TaxID=94130 RepID=A0A8H3QDQ3_9GLOM|nr:hypothetical protein RCL_jg7467.t1 [Rhizophagus clarus]